MFCDVFFPVFSCGRLRKVHKNTGTAPPRSDAESLCGAFVAGVIVGCLDEHVFCFHLFKQRMYQEHAGLDVRRNCDAALFHRRKPRRRILESGVIPCKRAAFDALLGLDRAVAGRKLEAIHRDSFFFCRVDEFEHRVVAVFRQFRIVHRAAKVAERRLREQNRLARQIRIPPDDVFHGRSRDQEQINISGIRAEACVAVPVVSLLPAHVKVAFRRAVVEIADRLSGCPVQADIERDMLVQRVCFLRVISHRVAGRHVHELFCFVDFSGLFSKSVKTILRLNLTAVNPSAVRILPVGKIRNVRVQERSVLIEDQKAHRFFLDNDPEPPSLNDCAVLAICNS